MSGLAPLLVLMLSAPAQECVSDETRPGVVSFDEAFESGLRELVREAWAPRWGRGIASLRHTDSAGLKVTVQVDVADSLEESGIASMLEEALRVTVPEATPLWMILHDGSEFVFESVEEFARCPPAFVDRRAAVLELGRLGTTMGVTDTTAVVVRLWVGIDGRVGEAVVDQSSGSFALDAAVLDVARGWIFRPAHTEGIRVAVWLRFPITLTPGGSALAFFTTMS